MEITLKLTAIQAKVLFNTVDGAADAGSCKDGCTKQELRAMDQITVKLLKVKDEWINIMLDKG